MPTDNPDHAPVIRRRSTGEPRTDIEIPTSPQPVRYEPGEREPVRVVGRPRPHPRTVEVPEPRSGGYGVPGRATAITYTTSSYVHLFRVVLPRYLLAGVVLGAITFVVLTNTLWVALVAACLPLPVFFWWAMVVRKQARDFRRGEAPPPPGYLGTF